MSKSHETRRLHIDLVLKWLKDIDKKKRVVEDESFLNHIMAEFGVSLRTAKEYHRTAKFKFDSKKWIVSLYY